MRVVGVVLCLTLLPGLAVAQNEPRAPRQLSLAQALELARLNSPTYRQTLNDAGPAAADVRAAYGALLPTVNSSLGFGYSRAGSQSFANQIFQQGASTVSSSYRLSVDWSFSVGQLLGPSQSKALERLTEENIAAAGVNLTASVTNQYLAVLRARATADVARGQVARNTEFYDLAKALFDVGQGNELDVRQAEVVRATAEVQLLRAQQAETESKIELLLRMGLPTDADIDTLTLTEQFPLVAPTFELATLLRMAHDQSPILRAADAQREAASVGVKIAKSQYLPSIGVSTGLSGFTQQYTSTDPLLAGALANAQSSQINCAFQNAILERLTSPHPSPNGGIIPDCNSYAGLDGSGLALLPDVAQGIRDANTGFPFGYTRQPWSISLGVSLPLWDGFSRASRVSAARASEEDARESVRARRLEVDGQIQSGLLAVRTAFAAATIQGTNRSAAAQQLSLARQRYQLGNGTALELADAQNAVTQAEVDYVTAVYDYHLAVVALEATVGRPLR